MRSKTSLGAFKERMAWTWKSITTVMSVYGVNHVLLKRNRNISTSRQKNLYKHLIICSCIHVKCRHARNSNHLSRNIKCKILFHQTFLISNVTFDVFVEKKRKKKGKQSKRKEQKDRDIGWRKILPQLLLLGENCENVISERNFG